MKMVTSAEHIFQWLQSDYSGADDRSLMGFLGKEDQMMPGSGCRLKTLR
jgi:hypothetical protein